MRRALRGGKRDKNKKLERKEPAASEHTRVGRAGTGFRRSRAEPKARMHHEASRLWRHRVCPGSSLQKLFIHFLVQHDVYQVPWECRELCVKSDKHVSPVSTSLRF